MLAYREEGDAERVALLVHGYPESSYMWRDLMPALADAGWRAIAPDLAGFGDSPPDSGSTWERHVEALGRLHADLGLGPVVLVVHDWGGLIGLRWACENPGAISGLVISGTGFFADGRWHDMAEVIRTEGQGEQAMAGVSRELLGDMLRAQSRGISDEAVDEYWKAFADDHRRQGHLELYRSGDFEKLEPYEGRLADLGVPTLIVWGAHDRYASVRIAHRFHDEIPESEVATFHEAGHFVWEDEPEGTARAVTDFLRRRLPDA